MKKNKVQTTNRNVTVVAVGYPTGIANPVDARIRRTPKYRLQAPINSVFDIEKLDKPLSGWTPRYAWLNCLSSVRDISIVAARRAVPGPPVPGVDANRV